MNEEMNTIKATLLYVLQNGSQKIQSNVYYIVKTLFFAQQKHLAKYLCPIYKDQIVALKFGPVPSHIYDILKMARGDIKSGSYRMDNGLTEVAKSIAFEDEVFIPKEDADRNYLSQSNIACLDEAIAEVSKLSFEEILNMTHGKEWQRAYSSSSDKTMDSIAIAKEGGASEEEIGYLKENIALI